MVNFSSSLAASTAASIFALNSSSNQVALSTQRLATTNRLVRAGDDVVALAVSTKHKFDIAGLQAAQSNNTQANSLLQTAYGGLTTISDVLDDLNSLSIQAQDGTLTAPQRTALDLQFQQLIQQIDTTAQSTSFNGINLLDGSISGANELLAGTQTADTADINLAFSANIGGGQTVSINGTALTEGTDFAAGATTTDSLNNLAQAINNSTDLTISNLKATVVGGSVLQLEDRAGGSLGNRNFVDVGTSTAAFTGDGAVTAQANLLSFTGGNDNGTRQGSVTVSGSIGDSLVNTVSQIRGQNRFSNFLNQNPTNGQRIEFDRGTANADQDFQFRTTATAANHIQIGATPEETMQNAIQTIGDFTGDARYVLDQLEIIQDGQDMVIRNRRSGNGSDFVGNAFEVAEGATPLADDGNFLSGGANTGVNVDGVTNGAFNGTISGFSATFNSADDITASVTVGSFTYEAEINDTTPAANGFVRFKSTTDGGGYFDVELATAGGLAVGDQTDANTYASRLNAAFSSLSFDQSATVDSFTGVGGLAGGRLEIEADSFDDLNVTRVDVSAASPGGNATIEIEVNGEIFRSGADTSEILGGHEIFTLESTSTGNTMKLHMGANAVDLSSAANAATFELNLEQSLGLGEGEKSLDFQVGSTPTNKLQVSIGSATTESLFDGQSVDLLSVGNATTAQTVIQGAIDELGAILAETGALQSRTDYISDALASEIQAKDEARAALADTDIAYESAQLAKYTVQSQTAVAVLAQTNALRSSLLDLVRAGN